MNVAEVANVTGTNESSEPAPPALHGWLEPIATKRFAVVGDVIYALTVAIALALSFGLGAALGETFALWSVVAVPFIWLAGWAIKYKLNSGPFGSSW